jgi:hypothetical protein
MTTRIPPFNVVVQASSLRPIGLYTLVTLGVLSPRAVHAADWWFQAGPVYRTGMAVRVSGSSYTQTQGLHAAPPVPPADSETYADRTYDDGYVKLDPGTANPESVGGPGFTWNWAYDRAEQYDAPAGLLSFQRSYERAAVPAQDGSAGGHEDLDGFGVTLQAGRTLHRSGRWSLGLGVGFQGVWGLDAALGSTPYAEDIGRLDLTDRFDVAGAVHPDHGFAPPRTAPGGYAGTYAGPAGDPSTWIGGYPVIPNVPAERLAQLDVFARATSQVAFRFDEDYYEITFSPRLAYQLSHRLSAYLAPKLGLGIAVVEAERTEVFQERTVAGATRTLGAWTDQASGTESVFTCGLAAGLEADLGRGFFLGALGGYDWVVDPIQFDLGPSEVTLDNSGWTIGLALRKTF